VGSDFARGDKCPRAVDFAGFSTLLRILKESSDLRPARPVAINFVACRWNNGRLRSMTECAGSSICKHPNLCWAANCKSNNDRRRRSCSAGCRRRQYAGKKNLLLCRRSERQYRHWCQLRPVLAHKQVDALSKSKSPAAQTCRWFHVRKINMCGGLWLPRLTAQRAGGVPQIERVCGCPVDSELLGSVDMKPLSNCADYCYLPGNVV